MAHDAHDVAAAGKEALRFWTCRTQLGLFQRGAPRSFAALRLAPKLFDVMFGVLQAGRLRELQEMDAKEAARQAELEAKLKAEADKKAAEAEAAKAVVLTPFQRLMAKQAQDKAKAAAAEEERKRQEAAAYDSDASTESSSSDSDDSFDSEEEREREQDEMQGMTAEDRLSRAYNNWWCVVAALG